MAEAELLDWAVSCLMRAGAERGPASTMARILLAADTRGHYSHGFNRLDIYCGDIARYSRQADTRASNKVIRRFPKIAQSWRRPLLGPYPG